MEAFDNNPHIIFNMTVWETFEDLKRFVFNQVHGAMMQDRDKWIDRLPTQVSVMWWVKAGERPTIAEAREKIALINRIGPSALAFDFKSYFGWEDVLGEKRIVVRSLLFFWVLRIQLNLSGLIKPCLSKGVLPAVRNVGYLQLNEAA